MKDIEDLYWAHKDAPRPTRSESLNAFVECALMTHADATADPTFTHVEGEEHEVFMALLRLVATQNGSGTQFTKMKTTVVDPDGTERTVGYCAEISAMFHLGGVKRGRSEDHVCDSALPCSHLTIKLFRARAGGCDKGHERVKEELMPEDHKTALKDSRIKFRELVVALKPRMHAQEPSIQPVVQIPPQVVATPPRKVLGKRNTLQTALANPFAKR